MPRMKGHLLSPFLRLLYWPRTRRQKAREEEPTARSAHTSSFVTPPYSTLPSKAVQHEQQDYYDLAQRVRQLLPPSCNQVGPGDIQFLDAAPVASGGFSEVWRGSLRGLPVVVKSLRTYSSPEFNPGDVGIVRLRQSTRSRQC